MKCPKCGEPLRIPESRCCDTYQRRRRKCPGCGYKFTTYERAEKERPGVVQDPEPEKDIIEELDEVTRQWI